jgi:ribosome-associated heat shock protein Hsp15
VRVDKWLWAARFYKTRSLAQRAIAAGQIRLGDARVKASHELRVGDDLVVRKDQTEWRVVVRVLSETRGPAEAARRLYEERPESLQERARRSDLRRFGAEPASTIKGRPTKRDRRRLEELAHQPEDSSRGE